MTIKGPEVAKLLYSQALPQSNGLVQKITADLNILQTHDVGLMYTQSDLLNIKQKILDMLVVKVSYPT